MRERSWEYPWSEPLRMDHLFNGPEARRLVWETNLLLDINNAKKRGDYDLALQNLKKLIHYKIDHGYYGGKNLSQILRQAR